MNKAPKKPTKKTWQQVINESKVRTIDEWRKRYNKLLLSRYRQLLIQTIPHRINEMWKKAFIEQYIPDRKERDEIDAINGVPTIMKREPWEIAYYLVYYWTTTNTPAFRRRNAKVYQSSRYLHFNNPVPTWSTRSHYEKKKIHYNQSR